MVPKSIIYYYVYLKTKKEKKKGKKKREKKERGKYGTRIPGYRMRNEEEGRSDRQQKNNNKLL